MPGADRHVEPGFRPHRGRRGQHLGHDPFVGAPHREHDAELRCPEGRRLARRRHHLGRVQERRRLDRASRSGPTGCRTGSPRGNHRSWPTGSPRPRPSARTRPGAPGGPGPPGPARRRPGSSASAASSSMVSARRSSSSATAAAASRSRAEAQSSRALTLPSAAAQLSSERSRSRLSLRDVTAPAHGGADLQVDARRRRRP